MDLLDAICELLPIAFLPFSGGALLSPPDQPVRSQLLAKVNAAIVYRFCALFRRVIIYPAEVDPEILRYFFTH